jgi:hypothetical protein
MKPLVPLGLAAFLSVPLSAQWVDSPAAPLPRRSDGKAHLAAPPPLTHGTPFTDGRRVIIRFRGHDGGHIIGLENEHKTGGSK